MMGDAPPNPERPLAGEMCRASGTNFEIDCTLFAFVSNDAMKKTEPPLFSTCSFRTHKATNL